MLDEVHLRRVLAKYFAYYNAAVTCRSPAMPRNPGWSRGRSWVRWSNFPKWEDSTIGTSVLQRDGRGSRGGSGAARAFRQGQVSELWERVMGRVR